MMASFDPEAKILLVMALNEESGGLFEAAGANPFYTGMGQVRATYALTQALLKSKPPLILNLGTAGSFDLPQGVCVECSAFVQRQTTPQAVKTKKILAKRELTALKKVICGTADFIQNQKFTNTQPFDIMDMEAYALAYVAEKMNVPFYSVKFISDNSNENVVTDWKRNLKVSAENLLEVYRSVTETKI